MDKKKRQQALNNISKEDLEKVKQVQGSGSYYTVDEEWLLLAEFGMTFGWDAYIAVKNDEIDTPEMYTLIEASRKVKSRQRYEDTESHFISIMASKAKKQSSAFKKATKSMIKNSKADE